VNKLLVTGLALGGIGEGGPCSVCNYDFEWLLSYPSILLWADKIIVTPKVRKTIGSGHFPKQYPHLGECIRLIFDTMEAERLLEVRDAQEVMSEAVTDAIYEQIEKDHDILAASFPGNVRVEEAGAMHDGKHTPKAIVIDDYGYCTPHLWSIYAGLILSRAWGANCLFNDVVLNYCKFKFGISDASQASIRPRTAAFEEILRTVLPEVDLFPVDACRQECATCAKQEKCSRTVLSQLEGNMRSLLKWRDYDEVHELRRVIDKIADAKRRSQWVVDPADIVSDFRGVEKKMSRRLHSLFPKVRRWTNMTTILSIPVVVAGVATGTPFLTVGGAALAGLARAAKESVDRLASKYSWVSFINSAAESRD